MRKTETNKKINITWTCSREQGHKKKREEYGIDIGSPEKKEKG
jgi:hypothetical protein